MNNYPEDESNRLIIANSLFEHDVELRPNTLLFVKKEILTNSKNNDTLPVVTSLWGINTLFSIDSAVLSSNKRKSNYYDTIKEEAKALTTREDFLLNWEILGVIEYIKPYDKFDGTLNFKPEIKQGHTKMISYVISGRTKLLNIFGNMFGRDSRDPIVLSKNVLVLEEKEIISGKFDGTLLLKNKALQFNGKKITDIDLKEYFNKNTLIFMIGIDIFNSTIVEKKVGPPIKDTNENIMTEEIFDNYLRIYQYC